MNMVIKLLVLLASGSLALMASPAAAAATSTPRNVIFFMADDMRPQLKEAYGVPFMQTPNFDKFARDALVFDRAYTNFAICSQSRNSMMTGRLPDRTRVFNFIDHFREAGLSPGNKTGDQWISLPEFFKNHGYTTLGHGKLYHPNKPPNWDEPKSWSQSQQYYPPTDSGCSPAHAGGATDTRFCIDDHSPANQFSDRNVTLEAIQTLGQVAAEFKTKGTPFFLGLGLHYPHQPWHIPLDVAQSYPAATSLPAPKNPYAPKGTPDVAFTAELDGDVTLSINEDLKGFENSKPPSVHGVFERMCPWPGNNSLPTWFQQQLRLGYYSAVTWTDTHFGMLMDALDQSGVANDTLVIAFADHGWQLGEHAEWGKHTNYELALRVPVMMRAPWKPQSMGKHTSAFFELIDVYKTLVGAVGLPAQDIEFDVQGVDQSGLLSSPTQSFKNMTFAQYTRCPGGMKYPPFQTGQPDWFENNCETVPAQFINFTGMSVRDDSFRYTEWYRWDGTVCAPAWDQGPYATELYSHENETYVPIDFDSYENENVVNKTEYAPVVQRLSQALQAHFKQNGTTSCPPGLPPSPAESPNWLKLFSAENGQRHLCSGNFCWQDGTKKAGTTSTEGYMPDPGSARTKPLQCYVNKEQSKTVVTTPDAVPEGFAAVDQGALGVVFDWQPKALRHGVLLPLQLLYNAALDDYMTCARPDTLAWAAAQGYVVVNAALGYIFAEALPASRAALEFF